ncbi:hypothetical protein [Jannaschia aquimarina]|uniref:Excalibur calcium-binding domain-containing protein n=1 Tax=Jannaschia aquimarina TaxID=935700 RepID=A0A0D1DBX4_9RHOB|nr:hypothetical protein [Jannaschia aquimarina]KIT17508.1 hypothetical protein jaqu_06960 [Jannaschia aquimarina]SNS74189.1 hypothetical protein SAMN05421775_102113 [Jannaschia aquimarina]
MRKIPLVCAVLAVAACAGPVPDSRPDFNDPFFDRGRGPLPQQSSGVRLPDTIRPPSTPVPRDAAALDARADARDAAGLARETRAALGRPADPIGAPAPLPTAATASLDPSLDRDNASISTEQDFGAVSNARTIQEDAERLRQAQQQRLEVRPEDVQLERPGDTGPNLAAYALNRASAKGAAGTYRRSPFAGEAAAQRRCNRFRSADAAQTAFLERGGPERDRLGLDPDGDGNACAWDPAAFRRIVQGS